VNLVEVRVPDLGDAKGVTVLEVLVNVGSQIRVEDPLITLESEKASMDVPSPVSGTVASIAIKKGQEISAGTLIATVRVPQESAAPSAGASMPAAPAAAPTATSAAMPAVTPAATQAAQTPSACAALAAAVCLRCGSRAR